MRPSLHPSLVNGRFGDPAVYVETLFEKQTLLFDLGDIGALSPRKIQRVTHVFVSHAHIDHFIGFDRLLRLLVGREKTIHLYGPPGFIGNVRHKLQAYLWNLVDRFQCDLIFVVTEVDRSFDIRTARFRLSKAFAEEASDGSRAAGGVLLTQGAYRVSTAMLDHHTPCLAFALEEDAHANVWKNRLAERGLPVGPWLRELKRAVLAGLSDDHPIHVGGGTESGDERTMALGALRQAVTITPGQKIAYVTDVANTEANRGAIVDLARGADLLFIEAAFADADAELAAERGHLTTTAAGEIARAAGVCRVEPFHFSPRYEGEEQRMLDEVRAAFASEQAGAATA